MSDAKIVAIETSGREGSVAVARGREVLAVRELPSTMRHAVELMPAIAELTAAQGWKPSEIEQLYLSLGPGSFTGLRIAVAMARAMAQATGVKLVGVPSLDVIAHNAPGDADLVLPILDAKRGQVFSARYGREAGRLVQLAGAALVDPRTLLTETLEMAAGLGRPAMVAVLGEGVPYHREALRVTTPANVQVVELPPTEWPGKATTVHRLGLEMAEAGRFSDPATLLPIYIRLPEAEEVYRKKHGLPLH